MTPIILRKKPALTMSPIFKRPVPKTMALGGVATGIIKAHDAAIAVVTSKPSGANFRLSAAAEINGIIVAAKAVFDVTSVAKVTNVATPAIIATSPVLAKIAA